MVTIKDIAQETGLSPATVARALGDDGPARPETRAKVREAAAREPCSVRPPLKQSK